MHTQTPLYPERCRRAVPHCQPGSRCGMEIIPSARWEKKCGRSTSHASLCERRAAMLTAQKRAHRRKTYGKVYPDVRPFPCFYLPRLAGVARFSVVSNCTIRTTPSGKQARISSSPPIPTMMLRSVLIRISRRCSIFEILAWRTFRI